MTDSRFLSYNSVIYEANHVKCKTLIHDSWAYKSPNNYRNRSNGSPLGATLYQNVEIFNFWGPRSHPRAPIGAKLCTLLRVENGDFWPVTKFNSGSLPVKSRKFWYFGDPVPTHVNRFAWIFVWQSGPLGRAKFHVNRCNESPLRSENTNFWLVSKHQFADLRHPAGNKVQTPHFCIYSRRALFDLPKLCIVVELVVHILKGVKHFRSSSWFF